MAASASAGPKTAAQVRRAKKAAEIQPSGLPELLPAELAKIGRLEVAARAIVEGFLSGMHRSPFFGDSVDFVQHREYVPGDDTRRIDWKAWSKTDKYYIKLFEEETNLRTMLLVDISESMQFASGPMSKYVYSATVAGALAHLLLRQQDAVGLVSFDDAVRARVPVRSGRGHFLQVINALASENPQAKTGMSQILSAAAEEMRARGIVVVLSDFFTDRKELFAGLKLLRSRGHDVLLFHILDDEELDFDYTGTTKFEGMEDAGEIVCDPKALRDGYLKAMTAFLEEMRREASRLLCDYRVIRTSEPLDAALAAYLKNRLDFPGHITD